MGYTSLKSALDAVVKTNGQQQITGSNLNGVLTTLLKGVDVMDRENGVDTTGMSKIVLDRSKTFAEQVVDDNTIYEIRDNYDLGGANFTLPNNVYLKFAGGRVFNGVLQGKLLNPEIDLRDIGVTYDSPSSASANGSRLAILSGITSDVKMIVSSDVTISGNEIAFAAKSLSLEGRNGAVITLSGFSGLSAKRINAKNLSVSSSASILFKIPSFVGGASFHMSGCKFTGDIRVLSCVQYAADLTHYVESFSVKDCVFENVHYSVGSNILFMLIDCIVNKAVISGNVVHNTTAIVFDLAITNGSTYESVIPTSDRLLCAMNNIYYNDLSFKPWANASITQPGSYLCFIIMERGHAYVHNNIFKNVLVNNAGCACYDNYLSVEFLSFQDNVWENCGNLTGEYIILMKGKSGINASRIYKNNSYLLTDLSTDLGVEDKRGTEEPQIVYYDVAMEFVEITGNTIKMSGVYCNPYQHLRIKELVFKDNHLQFESFVKLSSIPSLFTLDEVMEKWDFTGNKIELVGSASGELYLFGTTQTSGSGKLTAKDNIIVGFTGLCGNYNNNDIGHSLCLEDNSVNPGSTTGASSPFVFYGRYSSMEMRGNLFEFGSKNPIINGISKVANLTIDLKTNSTAVAVIAIRTGNRFPTGKYSAVVSVRDKATNAVRRCCLNFENNNGTITYAAYNRYGVLTAPVSGDSLYSEGGGYASIQSAGLNIQNMLEVSKMYEINVCVKEVSNINILPVIPKAVATADRPTLTSDDAGFTILDKTLGKMILWNGTAWVNVDGSAIS